MRSINTFAQFVFPILITCSGSLSAQEWSRFRGPNGTGHGQAPGVPTEWRDTDFNWKVKLPGIGHASPVLWGNHLFVVSSPEGRGGLIIQNLATRDGGEQWRREVSFPAHHLHKFNSFASSSPAVDADRVYLYWATPSSVTLTALTHEGRKLWERDLGTFESQHGGGTSPMIYDGKVVIGNEQMGASYIAAFDAATGEPVWRTPRRSTRTAYSTPCVYEPPGGKPQLIFNSQSHGIYAVDPDNGQVIWEYADAFDKRSVSSPVVVSGLIIGTCGSGGGGNYVVAVRPPSAAHPQPELAFKINRSSISPYVPTSVAVGDHLFLWSDSGYASCVHAPTGEIKWSERVNGNYFASPIRIGDRLFNISTAGEVVVLKASDEFQVLARHDLGELSHATPAVAGGVLYVRTLQHLYSVGQPDSQSAAAIPPSL